MAKKRLFSGKRGRLGAAGALAALIALAVGGGASSADPSAGAAATKRVSMGDNFFDPAKTKVAAGDKVRWTNNGQNPHNVTFEGGFASGNLGPGEGAARKFKRAGKFAYVCTIHPGMRGSVKVSK